MFFAVTMWTHAPLSICRTSMKLGSNAKMYGYDSAKDVGVPSQSIFHSGRARHPLRLTKNENSE